MTENFPTPNETEPLDPNLLTTMYQDLLASRPLEFEVYLGNPVRMAEDFRMQVPNLQALYAVGRHINKSRTKGDAPRSPPIPQTRQHLVPPRQSINGRGRGIPTRSYSDGPLVVNGRGRPVMNGHNSQGGSPRQGSAEGDFDQFKEVALRGESIGYVTPPNGEFDHTPPHQRSRPPPRQSDYDLRSRELMLRERELQLREREIEVQRRQGRIRHNVPSTIMDDDEDEDDSRSAANISQRQLMMGGDNFDMMSMTGRKSRNKQPSGSVRGKQPFPGGDPSGGRLMSLTGRSKGRGGSIVAASQATFDPLNENPLMGYTSNRYPGVDTRTLTANSRTNSLTSQRMDEMGMGPGAGRTASLLGGNGGYPVMSRGPPPGRGGPMMMGGPPGRGRPLPPQHNGTDYGSRGYHDPGVLAPGLPPKGPAKVRSITGSASASSASLGGNGESHSSSSSLEPPLHHGRI